MSRIRLAKQEKENTCEQQQHKIRLISGIQKLSPLQLLFRIFGSPFPLFALSPAPFKCVSVASLSCHLPLRLLQFSTLPSWLRVCETAPGAFRHSSSIPRLSPEETKGIACVDVGCLCDRWEFEDGLLYFCHCVCNKRKYLPSYFFRVR